MRDTLEYFASFRQHWNRDIENDLLNRFQLDANKKTTSLSKGQRTQLALISAICPEPETPGAGRTDERPRPDCAPRNSLKPSSAPTNPAIPAAVTVFVSTHLISEFEGLIDEFTIVEQGRNLLTMEADAARDRFRKIRARFSEIPKLDLSGALNVKQSGREMEILANGNSDKLLAELKTHSPEELKCESLSLEEIFVASDILKKAKP